MRAREDLAGQLRLLYGSRTVIVGIGHCLRGDDAAGPALCERLRGRIAAGLIDAGGVPENHIGPIREARPRHVLLVDAVDFGEPPGTIRLFWPHELAPFAFSTHVMSAHLFIDVVRRETEADVLLIGIQPARMEMGRPLSPPVRQAVEWLAATLLNCT